MRTILIWLLLMCSLSIADSCTPPHVESPDLLSPELLARIIETEARGESLMGKYLVGSVVINRVANPYWPDCTPEVVQQPNQFASPSCTYSNESMRAALMAIKKPYPGIFYFYNPKTATDKVFTSHLTKCFDSGNHRFCETCLNK